MISRVYTTQNLGRRNFYPRLYIHSLHIPFLTSTGIRQPSCGFSKPHIRTRLRRRVPPVGIECARVGWVRVHGWHVKHDARVCRVFDYETIVKEGNDL